MIETKFYLPLLTTSFAGKIPLSPYSPEKEDNKAYMSTCITCIN